MKRLLSIDPGLRVFGAAIWDGGELVRAAPIKASRSLRGMEGWRAAAQALYLWLGGQHVDQVAYETFRVYRGKVGFQADVLELAGAAGAMSMVVNAREYRGFEPREWTRGVPEIARNRRIEARLTPIELKRLGGVDFDHPGRWQHPLDAIGVGLYFLERY